MNILFKKATKDTISSIENKMAIIVLRRLYNPILKPFQAFYKTRYSNILFMGLINKRRLRAFNRSFDIQRVIRFQFEGCIL